MGGWWEDVSRPLVLPWHRYCAWRVIWPSWALPCGWVWRHAAEFCPWQGQRPLQGSIWKLVHGGTDAKFWATFVSVTSWAEVLIYSCLQGGMIDDIKVIEDDGKSFFYQLWYEGDFARFETPPSVTPSEDCKYKWVMLLNLSFPVACFCLFTCTLMHVLWQVLCQLHQD